MIPKYKQKAKHSWQDTFFAVLMSFLILTVVGFLVVSNYKISRKRAILNSQIEQLKVEIQVMQAKKQQLEAQLNQTSQEESLEKEARGKFNLKKPGEEVVTILPQEEKPKPEEKTKRWWNPFGW